MAVIAASAPLLPALVPALNGLFNGVNRQYAELTGKDASRPAWLVLSHTRPRHIQGSVPPRILHRRNDAIVVLIQHHLDR